MRKEMFAALAAVALATAPAAAAEKVPVTLRGSPQSMERQNAVAKENQLTFVRTRDEMWSLVSEGELVPLEGNADYGFASGVSGAVARPEVRTFIERLSAQYRGGCGERLIVTSLTRPLSRQPGNAHPLSVHPAGIAVDLRISRRADCRSWLEATLLSLEREGVLDITRESRPPHYHVALFPDAYRTRVERMEPDAGPVADTKAVERAKAWVAAVSAAQTARAFTPEAAPAPEEKRAAGGGPAWAALPLAFAALALARRRMQREES